MKTLERISKNSSLSLSSKCGGAFDPPKDSLLRELSSATVLKSVVHNPHYYFYFSSLVLLLTGPLECRFLFLLLSLQLFPYTYPLTTATRSLCALWGVLHPWWFFNSTNNNNNNKIVVGNLYLCC